jgi:predicted Zn-dependent peptidase
VLQQCLPDLPEGELEPWWTDTLKLDEYNFTHASKQAIVAMVFEGVTLQGEMDANFLPDIFCNALGGGMHSLLFDAVREKLGLCYHIGAHHSSGATGGSLTIFALLDEKNVPKAIEESGTIIDQVKAHGFDDELLDIAKRNYLFRLAKRRLTPMGIAGLLESYFSINPDSLNGYLSFEEHARRVGSLTNQDVMAFANRIFDPSKPSGSILMTCKDEQPEPTSELATAATSRSNCGEGWRVECD